MYFQEKLQFNFIDAGSRILLRLPVLADAHIMLQWENNPRHWFVTGTFEPFTLPQIEQFIENDDSNSPQYCRLMIVDKTNNQPLGCVDMFAIDTVHLRAGIAILIGEEQHRQKGYASEALNVLIAHVKKNSGVRMLFCNIHSNNIASNRLFTRLGFMRAGTLMQWDLCNNQPVDVHCYQLFL